VWFGAANLVTLLEKQAAAQLISQVGGEEVARDIRRLTKVVTL